MTHRSGPHGCRVPSTETCVASDNTHCLTSGETRYTPLLRPSTVPRSPPPSWPLEPQAWGFTVCVQTRWEDVARGSGVHLQGGLIGREV